MNFDFGETERALCEKIKALAAISPSLFLTVEMTVRIFGRLVAVYGTTDQKNDIIPLLKEGRVIGTVAQWPFPGGHEYREQSAGYLRCI
jgi:alkylation response protein AidB-like acyl-CoA dehydrogenase